MLRGSTPFLAQQQKLCPHSLDSRPQGGAQLRELALLSQCPKSCQPPFQSSPTRLVPASWECGQALPNPELARGLEFLTLLGLLMDFVLFFFAWVLTLVSRFPRGQSGPSLRLTPL